MSASSSNVRVAVRVRPLSAKEQLNGARRIVQVVDKLSQVVVGADRGFTFDFAFGDSAAQNGIFNSCVRPLVDSVMDGYNATVFAYGQTGSGKTYTMGTCENSGVEEGVLGMVPRAVDYLYERIDQWTRERTNPVVLHRTTDGAGNRNDASTLKVRVSFYEIHLENVRDLLQQDRLEAGNVQIRAAAGGQVVISGLKLITVKSASHLRDLLEMGSVRRSTGSTDMNASSSRSHAIFTVYVDQHIVQPPAVMEVGDSDDDGGGAGDPMNQGLRPPYQQEPSQTPTILSAKFHFVDLAGSERAKKSGAEGNRFKEAVQINQGLLCLGNVISALGDRKKSGTHVPFRDSKLTRILQDSLGGNSRTLMIACISPSSSDVAETLNTLKYANRARNIRNQPIRNEHREELALQTQLDEVQRQLLVLERQRQLELERQQRSGGRKAGAAAAAKLEERNTHIADLEGKLGALYQLAKQSSTTLRSHASRAARLCDDIRSGLGPDVDTGDGAAAPSVPAAVATHVAVPSGSVQMFGAAVLKRLHELSVEASAAADAAEESVRAGAMRASDRGTNGSGLGGGDESQAVVQLRGELEEVQAELARDEIIFASKNEEVLALQDRLRQQILAGNELQDEIDHLQWQLSQAQHAQQAPPLHRQQEQRHRPPTPQPGGWAASLFNGDDDDDVLMAEVDDDESLGVGGTTGGVGGDGDDSGGRGISTSPIDFDCTFTEHAGRQLRQHFGGGGAVPVPLRTPERHGSGDGNGGGSGRPDSGDSGGSDDERRARRLQARLDQQDADLRAAQSAHERAMRDLRIQMRQKQDLINTLTREEQVSAAALGERETQIAELEEDIDMYAAELRRAADELGRASQTELEHQRRQAAAERNERLLRDAEGQLQKLRRQQQQHGAAADAAARSDGARQELLQMKQRQVALMRQFKADEAARRGEAQQLRQRLARLRAQRDRQDLEISRLRESNKKQQTVIQQKDAMLRTYKQSSSSPVGSATCSTRSPVPGGGGRRGSGGGVSAGPSANSSFTGGAAASPSPSSHRRPRPGSGGSSQSSSSSPAEALAWFQQSLRALAAQLRAQRLLDDRLAELRVVQGQQESKTAERRRLRDLLTLRGRADDLDQTLGTLGRNLDAVASAAADMDGAAAELDEELDAIGVNVAHIRQEVQAARHQVATGLSFKSLVEGLERLAPAATAACLRWVVRALPEVQTEAVLKAEALEQLQGDLRQTEERARRLQTMLVTQQVDYAAQIARLQNELKRVQATATAAVVAAPGAGGSGGAARAAQGRGASATTTLRDIRSRMGDIRHTSYREGKMADEAKLADADGPVESITSAGAAATAGDDSDDDDATRREVGRLRQQLKQERDSRQNEVRRMNRYRWEREKLRSQLAAVQKRAAAQEQEHRAALTAQEAARDAVAAGGDVAVMAEELQAALEDCVFFKAQNKELKRKVKELGHSLGRYAAAANRGK